MNGNRGHRDVAHHHPKVHRVTGGPWVWACDCGGASCRTVRTGSWRLAVLEALHHATCLAP